MQKADLELFGDGTVVPVKTGRGAGGGRPKGYSPKKARQMAEADVDEDSDSDDRTNLSVRKVLAQTREIEAKAGLNELKLKIETGLYLPREAYREATATLLAALSQGLRSLPDMLERKHSLPPNVVQAIQYDVDAALEQVADGLALFHGTEETDE